MSTSTCGVASVARGCDSRGRRVLTALTLFLTLSHIIGTPLVAQPQMERAVLGTVVEPGRVEIAREPHVWTAATEGTPVLEDSELRSGAGETTMVGLGTHGMIGIREQSHVRVGRSTPQGLPLWLEGDGAVSFRLPLTTNLSVLTDAAVVMGPVDRTAPSAETSVQGIVTQQGGQTTVSVVSGNLRVRNRSATQFVSVGSGQQATIVGPNERPQVSNMTELAKKKMTSSAGMLGFLGTETGLVAAGATAAAIGGGLGGAAAAGAFSDDDDEGSAAGTASPFTP